MVFLSHSARDRRFVKQLAVRLRDAGHAPWFSEKHIRAAQQWHDAIGRALRRCRWFVIVLSPHAVKSVWVKRELLYVLNRRRMRNRIVPVLRADCDPDRLSWVLRATIQFIEFRRDFNSGMEKLLKAISARSR